MSGPDKFKPGPFGSVFVDNIYNVAIAFGGVTYTGYSASASGPQTLSWDLLESCNGLISGSIWMGNT